MKKTNKRRWSALLMTIVMALSTITAPPFVKKAEAATTISNPKIVADSGMKAGQKVTWDCIYFGSYPQAEVITTEMERNYTAIEREYREYGDLIVSDSIYQTLNHAIGWDINGDITINGTKYRRMRKGDAKDNTSSSESYSWYNWTDSVTYHYFKYEPIKWRVLKTDGNKAFLLADKILDDRPYNSYKIYYGDDITWEKSTIRSWLNGYSASANLNGKYYENWNFIDSAFTEEQQKAICTTAVKNVDNIKSGTEGGNDTNDKVFLLSESDVYTKAAQGYGFALSEDICDEARRSKSSTYAKAMGTKWFTETGYVGDCYWGLRSPGGRADWASGVYNYGWVSSFGGGVTNYTGVRPALNLNLSASNCWRYAGTVCSDGTEKNPVLVTGISLKDSNIKMTVGKTCQLQATVTPENATDKGVTYKSSNPKVATVNGNGLVKGISTGTTVITATTSDGSYQAKATVKVSKFKKNQTIKATKTKYTKTYGAKAFNLGAKTTGNGKLTYKSSNIGIAKVSSTGKVTIKGTGKAIITIKASATGKYEAATKKVSITVKPKRGTVKKLKSPGKGKLKVIWAKASKVNGYEITVATNRKFTKNKKTYRVKFNKKTTKTISGLKSRKMYYVKIRAYKTMKGSKKPLYGTYSKVKKIRVK